MAVEAASARRALAIVALVVTAIGLVRVPVPPGATQAWIDAHVAVVADDDTYQPVPATIAGGQALLRITLAPSACARDGQCQIGGAPIMVVAPAMPQVRAP